MNKPAAKEPTMDEILSSIRQIIADDDAAPMPGPRSGALPQAAEEQAFDDADNETDDESALGAGAADMEDSAADMDEADAASEMLELSEAQIIETTDADSLSDDGEGQPEFVVPDDIGFETRAEDERVDMSSAAPMPDPTLSEELSERLVDTTAQAAVNHAFSRLGTLALGSQGVTIEALIREMLKPMLKEWLDENLPSVVERLVEKEIERISRGGR